MKRTLVIFAAFLLAISCFAETKTFYFTRHGQRGDPKYQRKFKYCDEDALMPKGEEQAKLLAFCRSVLHHTSPFQETDGQSQHRIPQFPSTRL